MYIPHTFTQRSPLGYLIWRWLLRENGSFLSYLDAYFFGSSRGMNDYDVLAGSYTRSNVKPDKAYSILPTVLQLVGDCRGKTAIDMGCGTGFFTLPLAERGTSVVCGVDSSREQIDLARRVSPHRSIHYVVGDIFVDHGGPADIIMAPFVINYARTTAILRHFFTLIFRSLNDRGKVVFVVDLPNGKNLRRFGAVKSLLGVKADETKIEISLFREEKRICDLHAVYYTSETIERLLRETGFTNIRWSKPIVSEEGVKAMGAEFWDGYTDDPELGYLTAEK